MKPELVAAIFGIALAAFAGIVKLTKNISARNRERFSVRPFLQIKKEAEQEKPIKIILTNSGVGPAFIDEFTVNATSNEAGEKKYTDFHTAASKIGLNGSDIIFYSPSNEEEIPAGGTRIILEANPINSVEHGNICRAINGLAFHVNYSSVYGDKFQI